MKKLIFSLFVTAIMVACTSQSSSTSTSIYSANVTAEQVSQGKVLFEETCAKCHALPNPTKYTAQKWVGIMNWMAPKAKLTDEQANWVYHYVTK